MQPEERDAAYLWDMLQASRDILEFTPELLADGASGTGSAGPAAQTSSSPCSAR